MGSRGLDFSKHTDESYLKKSDGEIDSDLENEEDEATALVPPKKLKLNPLRSDLGSEPVGDWSECSSPSISGFFIAPASKPFEKKRMISKVFTDEEEIALLKGLAVFWANGRNNRWAEFHLFIKDDLRRRQFTKIQISEKIRSLKRKFETNLDKARTNGGKFDFPDHHEYILFELSKRLWGEEEIVAEETSTRAENEIVVEEEEEEISISNGGGEEKKITVGISREEFESVYPLLYASFDEFGCPNVVKENCFLIGREKGQELEQKWRELNAKVLRLKLKRIDLIKRGLLLDDFVVL